MTPVVPMICLAEISNREDMLESVNTLSNLARIQHHHQRIETRDQGTRTVAWMPYHTTQQGAFVGSRNNAVGLTLSRSQKCACTETELLR